MTRTDLETRLRGYFENDTYFQPQDLHDSVQDGYDEVVAFSGVNLKATTLQLNANQSYYDLLTLIPDFLGLISLFNPQTKRWMIPQSVRKLDRYLEDWETRIGTPEYFTSISHRWISIFRKPGDGAYSPLYVYYVGQANDLESDPNLIIPDEYLNTIEDYNITDLQAQQQEWVKASVHFQTYVKNLADLKVWASNRRSADRIASL